MKVLLREDVDNLGYTGEVLDVANGYGRNYLIPQGLAVKATPGVLKEAEAWRERAAIRLSELRQEHELLSSQIAGTKLTFTAKAGETGKLYGSVTTADVAEELNKTLGTEVDRKNVLGGPLRQLGDHNVIVRLSRDYSPQITVVINPEDEEEEEAIILEGEEDAVAEEGVDLSEDVEIDESMEEESSEVEEDLSEAEAIVDDLEAEEQEAEEQEAEESIEEAE